MNALRLLFTIDLSERATQVVDSLSLWSRTKCHLFFLHIAEKHSIEEAEKLVQQQLEQLKTTYKDHADLLSGADILIVPQDDDLSLAEQIVRIAHEKHIDIICMTSVGENHLMTKLLGSTTKETLAVSSIPVYTIPDDYRPDRKLDKIMLLTDLRRIPEDEMQWVKTLSNRLGLECHVAEVNLAHNPYLEETKNKLTTLHPDIHFHIIDGNDVSEASVAFIQEHEIDILITISKERNFWERLFHRSYTNEFIHESPIPIIGIK